MAIVQTVDLYQFREAFRRMNQQDQFSYEGLEVLFDYLENLSDDIGEPIELDVIALCCEYYESSIDELIENYDIDVSDAADEFEKEDLLSVPSRRIIRFLASLHCKWQMPYRALVKKIFEENLINKKQEEKIKWEKLK